MLVDRERAGLSGTTVSQVARSVVAATSSSRFVVPNYWPDPKTPTATPENAARILSALGDVDVREELARVKVPTLVLHCRGDTIVPFKDGVELASLIDGARFVPLDSDGHLLLESEPAWDRFTREVSGFMRDVGV